MSLPIERKPYSAQEYFEEHHSAGCRREPAAEQRGMAMRQVASLRVISEGFALSNLSFRGTGRQERA